ncbi:MAG: hypothetical protein H5U20_01550 [Rhodobacteraceae bacterium]|nr:hypothetical protein [Paracoccaceae bacterium]
MTRRTMPTAARVAPPLFAMLCAAGTALAEPAPTADAEIQAAVEAIVADGNLPIGAAALIAGLSGKPATAPEDATVAGAGTGTATAPATVLADTAEPPAVTPAPEAAPEATTLVQAGLVQAGGADAPPLPDTAATLAGLRLEPAPVLSLPADIVALSAVAVTPEPPTAGTPAAPARPLTMRLGAPAAAPEAPPARPFFMPWSTGVYR